LHMAHETELPVEVTFLSGSLDKGRRRTCGDFNTLRSSIIGNADPKRPRANLKVRVHLS
jgi:hypothetical protein